MTDKQLYNDILSAVRMVCEIGARSEVHGFIIEPPMRPGSFALRITSKRTVRCPWTGKLSYAEGQSGGSTLYPQKVARCLTAQYISDRELRAKLLAERKPAIQAGYFTHE